MAKNTLVTTHIINGQTITIAPITQKQHILDCIALQEATWNKPSGALPPSLIAINAHFDGISAAATNESGELLGFVCSIPYTINGKMAQWSLRLAVVQQAQNMKLGTLLKEYQRQATEHLGVDALYWTYDPLVAKNAHLNLNKLGATIDSYLENAYPHLVTQELPSQSDRLIVKWPVKPQPPPSPKDDTQYPLITPDQKTTEAQFRLEIPPNITELANTNPGEASHWQSNVTNALKHYFSNQYTITGLWRNQDLTQCAYYLSIKQKPASKG